MTRTVIRPSLKLVKAAYGLVLLILVFTLIFWQQSGEAAWTPVAAALLFVFPLQRHLRRQFTRMILEGDRLRYESGMVSKSTRTLQLSKVQDVRVDQSLGQRILRTGDISIETAGETSRLTVRHIDSPQAVADSIMDAAQLDSKGQNV